MACRPVREEALKESRGGIEPAFMTSAFAENGSCPGFPGLRA